MNTASAEHGFTNANIIFDKIKDIVIEAGDIVLGKVNNLDVDALLEKVNFNKYLEIELKKLNKLNIITGLGGLFAAAVAGKALVGLSKRLPKLAGGTINVAAGCAVTYALRAVYTNVLSTLVKNSYNAGKTDDAKILDALRKAFKNVDMEKLKKEWEENKDANENETTFI